MNKHLAAALDRIGTMSDLKGAFVDLNAAGGFGDFALRACIMDGDYPGDTADRDRACGRLFRDLRFAITQTELGLR